MPDRNYYRTMAEYNHWMNHKLYGICADIPDEIRRADRGAFFKSIHGTLNHLLFGDRVWLGRFLNEPFPAKVGEDLYTDFDQLRQEQSITDRQILDWVGQLSPTWLEQTLTYTSAIDGKTRTLPNWLLVTHLFNHQTHHRGQLTTLLFQLGYDPGINDLPWLPSLNEIS